jgi:hypothetical protein
LPLSGWVTLSSHQIRCQRAISRAARITIRDRNWNGDRPAALELA